MKQITEEQVREYIYDSKEEQLKHVAKMEEQDWTCTHDHRILKDKKGLYFTNATKDDYEWYARFTRPVNRKEEDK